MFKSSKKEIHEELMNLRMEIEKLREQLDKQANPTSKVADNAHRLCDLVSYVGAKQAFKVVMDNRANTDDEKFSQQLLAVASSCLSWELQDILSDYAQELLPVMSQIATIGSIPLTVIQELNIELEDVAEKQWNLDKGEQAAFMAGLINAASDKDQAFASLDSEIIDPALKHLVLDLLFDFDAFRTSFSDHAIRELLMVINNEDLTFALAGADEDVREVFLRNLSERARNMVEEDIEICGGVSKRDNENAQLSLVRSMRMLVAKGVVERS
ncbi:FliG C-terminal domain-containing protein [Maridesulfovibrio sp.]|uniref:FliG C-terminal domain-containing protein n=1 Tax=Maridesulfovibrio sp. TaxID=2795000 RepID=UPI0029CA6EA7|nr:FliG C-terminal domain-containing protein [Maridesulfovibrio sp.]